MLAAESPEGGEGEPSLTEIPAPSAEELAAAEAEQRERAEWLSSSEAKKQREASLTAYASLSAGEAKNLLVESFSSQLQQLNADPARVLSELEVEKPLGTYGALVSDEGGETAILNASVPVESDLGGEGNEPVSLALEESGGSYVPQNPVTDVELPSSVEGSVQLEGGVEVELPASDDHAAELLGEMNLFYPESELATDTLLAPRAGGLEIFEQLRSPESPEQFSFKLNLPEGATLRASETGGAEVISSSGETIEEVPPASAIDAQGAAVPVTTSVEGDSLVLEVQHRGREIAYPALLDPLFVNDTTSFGEWVPSLNSGYEYLLGNNGSSLDAISKGSNYFYPAGTHGQWAYAAYGQTSYIAAATFSPNYFYVHNCPTYEPHGYIGLYNPSWGGYDALGVYANGTVENSTYETGWKGGTGTKDAIIGIGTNSNVQLGCAHELYVGGYSIQEEDPEAPTVSSVGGISSGWAKELTVIPHVSDPGLGVKGITLSPEGSSPHTNTQGCSGANGSRCPGSWETSFGGSYFAEGERSASVSAYDPLGPDVSSHVSASYQFTTRVDRQKPEVELKGEFTEALKEAEQEGEGKKAPALHLPVYNLKIEATDKANEGNPQTEAKARRSGVKNIKVFLEGKELKVPWEAQGCSGPTYSCPMSETFPVPLNEVQGGGVHKLKVIATDQVGNEREREIEFEYFPATGIEDEYVMQHFPLPDGEGNEAEEEEPKRPELAVNVTNGNLVYRQRDVEVTGPGADLEVERFYNSQLPPEDDTEWGHGWTLAQTPKLEVEEHKAETPPSAASMVRTSGALQAKVGLPTETGSSHFDKKLQALVTKEAGGYQVADATGESDTALHFDETGKVTELSTSGAATVNYSYLAGDLSEIAVKDPATFGDGASAAPEPPTFVSAFGTTGSGDGQLSGPRGVAADGKGHVWIVDRANNRVEEFTEAGEYLGKFGSTGTGNGQFSEPWGITVTAAGNLWVADTGNARLEEFNSKGEFIQKFGTKASGESKGTEFIRPEGVVAAPGGMLWVSDAGGHRVAEFRESVSFEIERFIRNASGATLSEPISAAVDASGDVYVSDEEANHVFEFSSTGTLLQTIGSKGSGNGQLSGPTGVAVSPAGYIYVVDRGNNRVEVFTPGGEFLTKFGTSGTGNAQFSEPRAIAFGAGGALFVTDKGNNRVHRWGAAWEGPPSFVSAFGATGSGEGQLNGPRGIAADGQGHVWVVDRANNRVEEFKESGEYLGKFGSAGTGNGQFSEPWGITVTAAGNLWVADTGNARLEEFNSKGEFMQKFGTKASGESKGTEFTRPEGITSAPGGMLWVSDAGGHRLAEFRESVSSESERFVRNASGATMSEPISVATDASGDVYVADEETNHVFEFSSEGALLQTIGSKGSGNGQLSGPTGVAVSPAGYPFVVDRGNNRIEVFTPTGQFLTKFGTSGTGNAQFSEPRALAFGAHGAVFISDKGNNRIHRWGAAPEGPPSFISAFGTTGTGEGQLNGPRGIASDGKGHVWIVDRANNRVEEFDESGKYLGKFGSAGTGNGQFSEPWGITVTATGNLWVADTGNKRLQEFNSEGKYIQQFGTKASGESKGTEFLSPEGVTSAPGGMLWVSDAGGNRIAEFRESVSSESERFVRNATGATLAEPISLATDASGDLFAADEEANHVFEFSPEGALLQTIGTTGSGNGQLSGPTGVAIAPSGYIYVVDRNNNRVEVFTPTGEFLTKFGSFGTGNAQFSEPRAIAFGAAGSLFVTDKGNNRVHRWAWTMTEELPPPPAAEADEAVKVETSGGLVKSVTGEEAGTTSYAHSGQLLTAAQGPNGEAGYTYDSQGRLTKVTLPNGTWGEVKYDAYSRVESVTVSIEGAKAKTTSFKYTSEPRRTTVSAEGEPATVYDIAPDGSVLKWWNTQVPPEIENLSGSLYANKETAAAITPGDYELLVQAFSNEGIASIQVVANGNQLVDEKTCQKTAETTCKTVEDPWVTNTGNWPPGILQLEVIITDSYGNTESSRFWVNIPYTPPPDPEAPEPPAFEEVLHFREEFGLDLDLKGNEIAIDERIFNLIGDWYNPQTPAGEVARATAERWGVPLRAVDVAELEYRQGYVERAASVIEGWAKANALNSYAGYYVDHRQGGIVHIGFTQNQTQDLEAIQQLGLLPSGRLTAFPAPPTHSYSDLLSVQKELSEHRASLPKLTRTGIDVQQNLLEVGTAGSIQEMESALSALLGPGSPTQVFFDPNPPEPDNGRQRSIGRVQAGDEITSAKIGWCTANFGTWLEGKPINGQPTYKHFLLTAGHCGAPDDFFYREGENPYAEEWERDNLGHVKRNGIMTSPQVDGEAILLEGDANGAAPRQIYLTSGRTQRVTGVAVPTEGMQVCASGVTTNKVLCGAVVGPPEEISYSEPPVEGDEQVSSTWEVPVDIREKHGDSGSPVWEAGTGNAIGLWNAGTRPSYVTPLLPMETESIWEDTLGPRAPGALAKLGFTPGNLSVAK